MPYVIIALVAVYVLELRRARCFKDDHTFGRHYSKKGKRYAQCERCGQVVLQPAALPVVAPYLTQEDIDGGRHISASAPFPTPRSKPEAVPDRKPAEQPAVVAALSPAAYGARERTWSRFGYSGGAR